METVKLSFNADGELKPNRVVTRIEAYEALDLNTAWAETQDDREKTRLSNVRPAKRPPHATDTDANTDESPEARKKRMAALDEMGVR